jgi:hypothetical protein
MKKQILSIGKVLSKTEQKAINVGALSIGGINNPCPLVLLAAPPEGCHYITVPGNPCPTYKLICLTPQPY